MTPMRYEHYKDSGVSWLGEVPAHWEVKKLRYLTQAVYGGGTPDTSNEAFWNGALPWVSPKDMKTERITTTQDYVTELAVANSATSLVEPGAVLIVVRSGILKHTLPVAINSVAVTLNQDMKALLPNALLSAEYLAVLLKGFQQLILTHCTKIGATVDSIESNWLFDFAFPAPPREDQTAIVNYLDRKTGQLDALLREKEALLDLLRRKRQALITEAVTRGLGPAAPRKPSGINWLGEVPAHWEVKKIGRSFSTIGSGTTPESGADRYYQDGTISWVNTGDLNDGILDNCEKKVTHLALQDYSALKVYQPGTLLVAMYGATIGKTSLLTFEACTNQACCALSESSVLDQKFTFYWFISNKQHIVRMGFGGGQPNISQDTIRNLRIPTPPLAEQTAIVAHLDRKTGQIDTATAEITRQIELLRRYRQTLISEVVTGKRDVRPRPAPVAAGGQLGLFGG